jgi:hypothetical protein
MSSSMISRAGASADGTGRLIFVDLAVPAPVAPLAVFRLGARGLLLLGALAPRGRVYAARRGRAAAGTSAEAARATRGSAVAAAATGRATGTTRRAAEAARTGTTIAAATTGRAAGTTGRAAVATAAARTAGTTARTAGTRTAEATAARARTAAHGLGLSLLHDDRAALEETPGQLLDGRLRAIVRHRLDERKATGTTRLTIERDTHAAELDALARERLAKLLLVDVVRKVADEKTRTHRFT